MRNSRIGGLALAAALLLTGGCFRENVQTLTVDVPSMRTPACADIVREALEGGEHIQAVRVDLEARQVEVVFNSLYTAHKNIEQAIAEAGFDANAIPADPEARDSLPKPCREESP